MTVVPCIDNTGCGINIETDVHGHLSMEAIISTLACNGLACTTEGLFVKDGHSGRAPGTLPLGGGGWTADLNTFPVGFPVPVVIGPVDTFTNESTCFFENLMRMMTMREVEYNGFEGAHFRVTVTNNIGGFGPTPIFIGEYDYRFTSTSGDLITDKRAGGSHVFGTLLAPGQAVTFQYVIVLTNLAAVPPGSRVTSPGLTFCWISETN